MRALLCALAGACVASAVASGIPAPRSVMDVRRLTGQRLGEFNDKSAFSVVVPFQPAFNHTYRHSEALFGIPSYGASVQGFLQYDETINGCDHIAPDRFVPGSIIMVDRGGCQFVDKVSNIQNAGARAAIIADTNNVCGIDDACPADGNDCKGCPYYGTTNCACILPFMAASSAVANTIDIPSMMLGKKDTQMLKDCMQGVARPGLNCNGQELVQVELQWDLPVSAGSAVNVDLFSAIRNSYSTNFHKGFKDFVKPMGESMHFTPHFYVWNGTTSHCTRTVNKPLICDTSCTNGGRYCTFTPADGSGDTGADLMVETLRQICIYKEFNKTVDALAWWEYSVDVDENCQGRLGTSACADEQMQKNGISITNVNKCMENSGGTTADAPNTLLERALVLQDELAIIRLPEAIINGIVTRGRIEPTTTLKTACNAFSPGAAPKICSCSAFDAETLKKCLGTSDDSSGHGGGGGVPGWGVALIVMFVMVTLGLAGAGIYSYTRIKKDVDDMRYRSLPAGGEDLAIGGGADPDDATL